MPDPAPARPAPYRPEVDGLRAVAVLAAIPFHTGSPAFAAGYLGVDLFFVISGYLITTILLRERAAGTFTLSHFYLRRIRRILPALLAVILLAAIPALLWLVPDQLQNFGQSLTASALMGNNVLLWLTGGYWDVPARFKPLLHTWSLGVEEQFYLLGVPLMLLVLHRAGRRGLGLALGLVVLASLAASLLVLPRSYDAAYLLLPFRAWELALGGLIALLPRERVLAARAAPWLAALGGVLIAAALAGLAGADPASLAPLLLVCAGGALFIATADQSRGVGAWLALRPLVVVGLASFSAYLLHQPVFAYVRVLSLAEPPPALLFALVPAILLAALTDAAPLILAGHSAGAQLAIDLALDPPAGAAPITGILAISGVFDLEPLLDTSVNAKLGLDAASARAASPLHRLRPGAPPALFAVGAEETRAFQHQTARMARAWAAAGNVGSQLTVPEADHFSILQALSDEGGVLRAALCLATEL